MLTAQIASKWALIFNICGKLIKYGFYFLFSPLLFFPLLSPYIFLSQRLSNWLDTFEVQDMQLSLTGTKHHIKILNFKSPNVKNLNSSKVLKLIKLGKQPVEERSIRNILIEEAFFHYRLYSKPHLNPATGVWILGVYFHLKVGGGGVGIFHWDLGICLFV